MNKNYPFFEEFLYKKLNFNLKFIKILNKQAFFMIVIKMFIFPINTNYDYIEKLNFENFSLNPNFYENLITN